ncbi:MAG TPA: ABC transporter permease/substrate-binding protein [Vicinamibacterales bacterium]|nr:ABC transporter permease/substrate-binding protein [Vicinamibacterales bacterium]
MTVLDFWRSHGAEAAALLWQHLYLVAASTGLAIALGIPIGVFAARRPRAGAPIVWLANVAQTIPSLAMFGFLLPLPLVGGLGARLAVTVLTLYALLPIARTTVAGLRSVDAALIEAGTALGMTARQLLWQVELPLALPSIVAGIRVATVIGVGTATIAAAVGAGGLGEYIFRGLAMVEPTVILAGAIPAALLALVLDGGLTLVERAVRAALSRGRAARVGRLGLVLALAAAGIAVVTAAVVRDDRQIVRVGSKNFTEQIILGELLAQLIETRSSLSVDRRLNLGGTFICDRAIRAGDIDLYVEYSGTAHSAIFHEPANTDPRVVLDTVRRRYAEIGLTLLDPLGFENTFAILVRGDEARRLELTTIGDAVPYASSWQAGFGYEFLERADGYPGLSRTYGLAFATPPRAMDVSLVYRALAEGQVDLVAGDATSGLIEAYDLTMLADDRRYFPPYDAAVVARSATLLAHPDLRDLLRRLAGRITVGEMRRMNHAVDAGRRDPARVVAEFLRTLA